MVEELETQVEDVKFGVLMIGAPGVGKSTLTKTLSYHLQELDRPHCLVNLDAANEDVKYDVGIDVRDLITLEDVMAVVADASELKLDPIVDGAFAGRPDIVESEFAKAMIAGTYPGVIISAAQRQAAWLHKSALAIADGTPASTVLDGGFPRLHFSRKPAVETALRNFSPARLAAIIEQLATAALDTRKQSTLAAAIAQRALMSIAANAKRRG